MPSGVVGLYQGSYKRRPVPLLVLGHRAEHLQKGPVETICAAVATRMIWCCPGLLYGGQFAERLNEPAIKITPLVAMELLWKREMNNKILIQSLSCRLSCNVFARNGVCKTGKVVRYYKNVFIATFAYINFKKIRNRQAA